MDYREPVKNIVFINKVFYEKCLPDVHKSTGCTQGFAWLRCEERVPANAGAPWCENLRSDRNPAIEKELRLFRKSEVTEREVSRTSSTNDAFCVAN